MLKKILLIATVLSTLTGCTIGEIKDGPPRMYVDVSKIPDAVPQNLPRSHLGNPPVYSVYGKRYRVLPSAKNYHVRGVASWYGTKFYRQRTSSGEPYDMLAMTAANKILPLPTFVRVTNLENGRHIIVKVNDRGPFKNNRVIDLSYVAAKKLDMLGKGTAYVDVEAIDPHSYYAKKPTSPLTQSPKPHKAHSMLYLQVAAFHDEMRARNLENRLRKELKIPMRVARSQPQSHIYKVQVGPLANIEQSDRISLHLIHHGYGEPLAVIE